MSHEIEYRDGEWRLRVESVPHCIPLDLRAPAGAVRAGKWLVLCVAVWSASDRDAVDQAISALSAVGSGVTLGIALFDSHDELRSLAPGVKTRWESPVWLSIEDGMLVDERAGMLSDEALAQLLRRLQQG